MQKALLAATLLLSAVVPAAAQDSFADQFAAHLYEGTIVAAREDYANACTDAAPEACFAAGVAELTLAYETMARALYRHGAVEPFGTALSLTLGLAPDYGATGVPPNPAPEPLDYDTLVAYLEGFVAGLDVSRDYFVRAGESGDYVLHVDPLRIRMDLDGDGVVGEAETPRAVLAFFSAQAVYALESVGGKSKDGRGGPTIGFDRADAIWLAGYTQVTAAPVDWLLAHDFSLFFNSYGHRLFPKAGLLMQETAESGDGFGMMDPATDAGMADLAAAIHTANFPVIATERLAGVRERLKQITALSRQNWESILAETDDDREFLPSPSQSALVPGSAITDEMVEAWAEALDSVDKVLDGELLLPHWRFTQGINVKTYFETAEVTDPLLMFTGQTILPFLDDGPIISEADFAKVNAAFGDDWPVFALWFN